MKLLLVACLASVALAGDHMLESNRVSDDATVKWADTCDECKTVIHSVVEAVDDPQKLAELKLLLNALCHETSYAEECRLFVSKIDVFIKRLEPYLRDAESVCKKMHLCHNPKLTQFHKVGLLYMKHAMGKVNGEKNDFVCDECQLAAIEFKKAIDDQNQRRAIQQFLSEKVCKQIRKYSGTCDLLLEEFLPELWQELDAVLANPKATCSQLGFCSASTGLKSKVSPKQTLASFWKKSSTISSLYGQVLVSCFECKGAVTGLLTKMETTAETQKLGYGLRDFVCPILPDSLLDGCNDFLTMYAPTVVYMTWKQLDPAKVCSRFKMCDKPSLAALAQMSPAETASMSCESCKAFEAFAKYELAQPDFKSDAVAGFEREVCSQSKAFGAVCENVAQSYLPKVLDKVVAKLQTGKMCTEWTKAC